MDKKALAVMIMAVCLIAIDGQKRKHADELQALTQYIGQRNIVSSFVVGIQRKDASCQCIHHIAAGRFHDDISDKAGGKGTVS